MRGDRLSSRSFFGWIRRSRILNLPRALHIRTFSGEGLFGTRIVSGEDLDYTMCKIQTHAAPEARLGISKIMHFLIPEGMGVVDRWYYRGSKADLLGSKVAALAVVTSGLESEVQCIPQKTHELRTIHVSSHHKPLFRLV
jgi:hypothetical protein